MKILLTLFVLLFVGFTMKAYSEELPSLFGIELGKPLPSNIQIININNDVKQSYNTLNGLIPKLILGDHYIFTDDYYVKPPIPNAFFQQYSVSIFNNRVYSINAYEPNRSCYSFFYIGQKEDAGISLEEIIGEGSLPKTDVELVSFEETILKEIKLKFELKQYTSGGIWSYGGAWSSHGFSEHWDADNFIFFLEDFSTTGLTEGPPPAYCHLQISEYTITYCKEPGGTVYERNIPVCIESELVVEKSEYEKYKKSLIKYCKGNNGHPFTVTSHCYGGEEITYEEYQKIKN